VEGSAMTRNRRARVLGALAAVGLAAWTITAAATAAHAAVTCPAVNSSTGAVTPSPSPGVDWNGCDLASAYMPQADLAGANLQNANLTGAYLPNANLASANLSDATLSHATIAGDDLSRAVMTAADLLVADVSGAKLESVDLAGASAWGAHFTGAGAENANLQSMNLDEADLTSADLFGASLSGATTSGTTWINAICPNGASANYYTDGCLSTVSVATPTATPKITGGTLGLNGWYTSGVTVTWHWVDSNSPDPASCPASTTTTEQGSAVVISASCTDISGNVGHSSLTVQIDTTPPVVSLTGFRNGATYPLSSRPLPACTTTDALSGVRLYAATTITGGRPDGTGKFTVTCTGAEDNAGNKGPDLSAGFTVVYLFGGFISPKVGATLSRSARTITVAFRLADASGKAIATSTAAALARLHDVRATLRGPGISPASATCIWNIRRKYLQCAIATPRRVRTGHNHRYSITAAENLGSGFVTAPADAFSENPEPVYFS
jgi:uncharacterized protein YjbI with pentapeptide repeats